MIQTGSSSDSYIKVVLPQIKDLLAALNLTKEDYRQHIQQAYDVESIRQLWPTEVFEVVTHFQNLFLSIFDSRQKVSNGSSSA